VGYVKDVVWNFKNNEVEALLVEESGGNFLSRITGYTL
jgi:sporulation protein YlmC with PRC-barrel domain